MKWEGREESENVEDRRGLGTGAVVGGGVTLVAVVVYFAAQMLGVDPDKAKQLANVVAEKTAPKEQAPGGPPHRGTPEEERMKAFSGIVLKDTEIVWTDLFRKMGKQYRKPRLIIYTHTTQSGCGLAESGIGPFYCPADENVYIDLSFYNEMQRKLNAPGDFARAYVIAHEVGHHVQRLLGYSARVDEVRQQGNKLATNQASVRLELQADYLAGVWAHHADQQFRYLEKGDVDTAIHAAFEIGDDRLQSKATGTIRPDSFTHGTSKQRMKWFMEGYKSGNVDGARQLFELRYSEL